MTTVKSHVAQGDGLVAAAGGSYPKPINTPGRRALFNSLDRRWRLARGRRPIASGDLEHLCTESLYFVARAYLA